MVARCWVVTLPFFLPVCRNGGEFLGQSLALLSLTLLGEWPCWMLDPAVWAGTESVAPCGRLLRGRKETRSVSYCCFALVLWVAALDEGHRRMFYSVLGTWRKADTDLLTFKPPCAVTARASCWCPCSLQSLKTLWYPSCERCWALATFWYILLLSDFPAMSDNLLFLPLSKVPSCCHWACFNCWQITQFHGFSFCGCLQDKTNLRFLECLEVLWLWCLLGSCAWGWQVDPVLQKWSVLSLFCLSQAGAERELGPLCGVGSGSHTGFLISSVKVILI